MKMSKIVVFSPHQDDEILACTYAIKQARLKNDEVFVVFVTNGDFEGKEFCDIRALESIKALERIGISRENIIFLGYGDGVVYQLFHNNSVFSGKHKPSQYTYAPRGFKTFHNIEWNEEAFCSKNSLLKDIIQLLLKYNPDTIYCPSSYDFHGDHKGTYLFVKSAVNHINTVHYYNPIVYTYIIHAFEKSKIWPNRLGGSFKRPNPKVISKEYWKNRIAISSSENPFFKIKLISFFKSQKPFLNFGFLYSFSKKEEVFWLERFIDEY